MRILVKEKQYVDGKVQYTGKVIQVKVEQTLQNGVHVTQISDNDKQPMTMLYLNEEIEKPTEISN